GEERDVATHTELAEQVADVHRGERDRGVAACAGPAGGGDEPAVEEVELDPRVTEGDQALHRLGAGAEWRRPGEDRGLERRLAAVQDARHQALAALEAPE